MFPQPKRAEARLTLRDRVRDESAYAALSDVVLAVRAQDGDRAALAALVERHEPRVRRLAGYLLDDPQDAEDAAQEALAKVLHQNRPVPRRGPFRRPGSTAWSPTPAATSASASAGGSTSRWRLRRRWRSTLGPHDLACQREQRAELARELEGLSNDQRHVMVMKDVLALSYEEIAEVLEMPVGHGQVPRAPRPCPHAPGAGAAAPRRSRRDGRASSCRSTEPAIEAIIPHRDPFLLVDEITELVPGERATGQLPRARRRLVSARPLPRQPDHARRAAGRGAGAGGRGLRPRPSPDFAGRLALFAGIDDVRFKRIVRPGDTLDLRCEITRLRGPIGKADATRVGGRRAGLPRDAHVRADRELDA